jgi:hypothetical protein
MRVEEFKHRNMSRYKPEGWLVLLIAVFLLTCLIVGTIHTLYSFKPNAEAILAKQSEMQNQLDAMKSEQAEMRKQIDDWKGVQDK